MSDNLKMNLMLLAATEASVSSMRMNLRQAGEDAIRAYTQFHANVLKEIKALPAEHRDSFATLAFAEQQLSIMRAEVYGAADTTAASLASAAAKGNV